ncbi:MAG: ThiF family adenylyltransferase [Spirochaeta sp.]|jgi:molybdopterin/thiamine biosynthesis adenylyltransferase|nr:ThiF family adenylyltransferase [Spirochaeta sp.]
MMNGTPQPHPDRYTRHRTFFSDAGWHRLTSTVIVIAGVGGLGSHVLSSVARLGPVKLLLWDPGVIDAPDLNRQVLYTPADIGRQKVEVAAEVLVRINPEVQVSTQALPITAERCDTVCASAQHVVFDCLDSFTARAELDAIRSRRGWTVFHGGVEGLYGQAVTFGPDGAGYAGVFGPEYATMAAAGKPILPMTVAVIAAMQVGEFVHWCNGDGSTPLSRTMFVYDGRAMRSDGIALTPQS